MTWGMIATWRMALEGVEQASKELKKNGSSADAVEESIKAVEDFPFYKSVGYGGLPNEAMEVELDAAFMNGTTMDFGAVCAIKDFANPISIARTLSRFSVNNVLVAEGAASFAHQHGFERKNMLTNRAKIHFDNYLYQHRGDRLTAYSGHDTVGILSLDSTGNLCAGTSTSGLFMKKRGRVGDSPFIGAGLYADSEIGAATATGLGEDIMKGLLSYEVVRQIKDGKSPQEACECAVFALEEHLHRTREEVGDISVVAMDKRGNWGAASTITNFSFVVATDQQEPTVYLTNRQGDQMVHQLAPKEWLDKYLSDRMKPLIRLEDANEHKY